MNDERRAAKQFFLVAVFFANRKVTAVAVAQMKRLWHTTCIYVTPPLQEYCEKLASLLPDPLKVRGARCLPAPLSFWESKAHFFPLTRSLFREENI